MLKGKKTVLGMMLVTSLALTACGNSQSASGGGTVKDNKDKTFKIGVTQIVEHPSLDEAFKGFQKALEEKGVKTEYEMKNAQGDPSTNTTIGTTLVNDKVDLIFANSTPSTQAALAATRKIPIVFSSVTDPVGAKLVKSMDNPGGNITGSVDFHPEAIPNTLKFIKDELGGKKIGLLYNSGEQNSVAQVEAVKKEMSKMGLEPVTASVATSAEVKQAAESMAGKIDSFYIVTDNTVVSALESVVAVSQSKKIPLIVSEFDSVKRGGFAAYGFSYFDIGHQAGEMASDILTGGKKAGEIPVQVPSKLKLMINKKAAEQMGIKIKPEWDKMAEYVK